MTNTALQTAFNNHILDIALDYVSNVEIVMSDGSTVDPISYSVVEDNGIAVIIISAEFSANESVKGISINGDEYDLSSEVSTKNGYAILLFGFNVESVTG